jgi:tRNA A-37 threonylcarbamoyl transferase component Bud32
LLTIELHIFLKNTKKNMVDLIDIKLNEVIRELPGKRRVVSGTFKKQDYIIKYFNVKKLYLRELKGSWLLINSGLPSPKVISFGKFNDEFYIVFEKIKHAMPVDDFLNSSHALDEKRNVVKTILYLNKKMYEKDILQIDNYFKNYLYSLGKIYLIDGGLVKKIKIVKRIRMFLNFSLISSKIKPEFFPNLNKTYKNNFIQFLHKIFISFFINKEISNFQKKTLRNSTQFEKESGWNYSVFKQRNFNFNFNKLDNFLANAEIVKNGNTCTVFLIDNLIIKRYNVKSIWHFIKIQFIKSRGKNSWQVSNTFQLLNLPCPKPFFYFEKRFFFLRLTTYFAMERIDGVNIVSYQESVKDKFQIEHLKKNIFKLFNKLNHYKFIHGDFKKTNILVDNKKKLIMIDFDKSFFSMNQSIYNYKQKKQVARFLSNWKNKSKFLTGIRSLEKLI